MNSTWVWDNNYSADFNYTGPASVYLYFEARPNGVNVSSYGINNVVFSNGNATIDFSSLGTYVTFNGVSGNGNSSQTTTQLTLTFSAAIAGLAASDISLSGVPGVTKGILQGSGPTYTLPISGFTSGGNLTVTVSKPGYIISPSSGSAAIFYSGAGPGTPATNGLFTLTNASAYNGKYAFAVGMSQDNTVLWGIRDTSTATAWKGIQISGGQVQIPIFGITGSTFNSFSGNGTATTFAVYIMNNEDYLYSGGSFTGMTSIVFMDVPGTYTGVTFSNGQATASVSSGMVVDL
jgi:hypothetical protein